MKIGLVYGHVASNLGDLSINMGVANIINKIFPESILHVVYKNPNEKYFKDAINSFGNLHNIEYYILNVPADKEYKVLERYIRNPLQFLEETGLNKCDVILANSGEFLFSYEFDERIDLLWRVLPAYASMQAGIKFITLPSTLGPFNDFIGTKILKQYLLLNDTFAARDALSLQLVAELLETNIKKLHLFLDPAFFIKEIEDKNISDGPRLGVIMRLDNFGLRTGGRKSSVNYRKYKKENFKTSLAYKTSREIIDKFINIENGKVDLYVQTRYDLELAESIYEFYANKGLNERISIIKPKTIESYIDSLSNSNFVVSSRFHGCILSFLANVPAMGIYFESHGHKMPGLYKMLDIEDYSFKLTETNVEEIGLKFIELYKNKYRSFNHLKEKVNSLKSETLSWLKQSLIEKTIKNKEVISSELMEYLGNVKFNIIENKLLKLEEQNSQLQKNIKNLEKKISEKKAQLLKTTKDYEELKLKIDHLIEVFNEVNNKLYFFEVQNNINQYKHYNLGRKLFNKISNYNKFNKLNVLFNLPNGNQVNIIMKFGKSNYLMVEEDKIVFNIPNGESVYITSKENFNFNEPPKHNVFNLMSNSSYSITGNLEFSGEIQLLLVEYDDNKKIKSHKYNLNSGTFDFTFKTHNNHKKMCIVIRLKGAGILTTNFDNWIIYQNKANNN